MTQALPREVRVDLDNHFATSGYISRRRAQCAIRAARRSLGAGGIVGLLRYDGPDARDPRWDNFVKNVPYDKVSTGNGIYLPEADILVLHGQELQTAEGHDVHIIGHQPSETIPFRTPFGKAMDNADGWGAWKGAAAPCHDKGSEKYLLAHPDVTKRLDAIEVYSSEAEASFFGKFSHANKRALELFEKLRQNNSHLIPMVGTDGHSPRVVGRSYATITMPSDYGIAFKGKPATLLECLRAGYRAAVFPQNFVMRPARADAYNHALDLIALICAKRVLGWDPNETTAPLLERIGVGKIRLEV